MLKDIFSMKVHIQVYLVGRCPRCKRQNEEMIFDYGEKTYRETEDMMDHVSHAITPLTCPCGQVHSAEYLAYRDKLRNIEISRMNIMFGGEIDYEQAQAIQEAHNNRFQIFREHEEEFWNKFIEYALENWRDVLNELSVEEFRAAYRQLNIEVKCNTTQQFRRDVMNRFNMPEQKAEFWKAANHFFIYDHMLDLGPMAWFVPGDIQLFGQKRVRFVVLNFPMGEALEPLRTQMIGSVVKKERGDNAFLFGRISQLTDEIFRLKKRLNDYHYRIEEMKAEIAEKNEKLNELYSALRSEKEKKPKFVRDPGDIRKIQQLKSFIKELMSELKQKDTLIQELQPDHRMDNVEIPTQLEESDTFDSEFDWANKTVGIIGGYRDEQSKQEYPCKILTHSGERLNPDFYSIMEKADILVVLTRFISHQAMWEAKAHAIEKDKPIFFSQSINIGIILSHIAAHISKEE